MFKLKKCQLSLQKKKMIYLLRSDVNGKDNGLYHANLWCFKMGVML